MSGDKPWLKSEEEILAFFLNLHNFMILFGLCQMRLSRLPQSLGDWARYEATLRFKVGPSVYTPLEVHHLVIRAGLSLPSFLANSPHLTSRSGDPKFEYKYSKANELVNLGVSFPYKSSPPLRIYMPETVDASLKETAGIFFARSRLTRGKQLLLPAILEVYRSDFFSADIAKEFVRLLKSCLSEEEIEKNEKQFAAWYCLPVISSANKPVAHERMCFDFKWNA